jgi:hypothetical protein
MEEETKMAIKIVMSTDVPREMSSHPPGKEPGSIAIEGPETTVTIAPTDTKLGNPNCYTR